MLIRSDELGDELKQARSLLAGSIHGDERLRQLADRYCCLGDLREAARDSGQHMQTLEDKPGRGTTPPL